MRKLAFGAALIGFCLLLGAGMLAFDQYMVNDRKQAVQSEVNGLLDAGTEGYEARRNAGCVSRCGILQTFSHAITTMRDGMFASVPVLAEDVFPSARDGWQQSDFDVAVMEDAFGREIRRTPVTTVKSNELMQQFEAINGKRKSGHVQFYLRDGEAIMMAALTSRDAIRAIKDGVRLSAATNGTEFARVDGIPIRTFPQTEFDWRTDERYPVEYRRFEIDLDKQIEIWVVAKAEPDSISEFFGSMDFTDVIERLPQIPIGYQDGQTKIAEINLASSSD